uniref:Carboxypeptidase n=1 Tax=Panagrolaimus sp. ES5 TaxID=591445 RepID=A0AC34FWQ8_9BILA
MGPYQINSDGKTLKENPNAWNKFASIVYIEAPAGVGYSYSTRYLNTTDDLTAEENYVGIKQFFKRHPKFRFHSTFIMGESYGGIYIPMLTSKIIENQKHFSINLSGMAIGNGALSVSLMKKTGYQFLYSHGLIDEQSWRIFKETCCNGCIETCNFDNITNGCFKIIYNDIHVNPYDIYGTCDSKTKYSVKDVIQNRNSMMTRFNKNISKSENIIPCLNDSDISTYMNLPAVRKALHIPDKIYDWQICNNNIFNTYKNQYSDMTSFFKKVINAKIPILLYYGDTDSICNFKMGQKFSLQLGLPLIESGKAWMVNGQVAGFKTVYDGLTFTTIRGAGHMAPQWRAPETAHAIKQFVLNQPV